MMMMNKSNLNSARSESSKKTSISDDELEKSVYFPDVANVSDIDTLEPKNKTEFCSCYLKDKTNKLFKDYPNIFNSDLKKFFKNIASEDEKNINYNLLSEDISLPYRNTFSFFCRYGYLQEFCFALFEEQSVHADDIKSEQIKFLNYLMNGYKVYKRLKDLSLLKIFI